MNKRNFSILTIIFLSTFLGYQLIELINYVTQPQAVSFDDKIETPELLNLENEKVEVSEEKNTTSNLKNINKHKFIKNKNSKENTAEKTPTKPTPKNKFLNVIRVAEEEFRHSKDDYLDQIKKQKASGMINVDANFAAQVLESETLIEKSLQKAASKVGQMGHLPTHQFAEEKDMERFAIKIELPSSNDGAKFKLQYREPPGPKEVTLPDDLKVNRTDSAFSIEKTTATESPWDNFSGPR